MESHKWLADWQPALYCGAASAGSRHSISGNKLRRGWTLEKQDGVSVEDAPQELGVADDVFRAAWAAECAGYLTEAAEHLRQTAMQEVERCSESLGNRQAPQTSWDDLEPEELRLAVRARSMSHASALLSLFALEIALKGYQIRDCGQHSRDHDLQRLFDSLNSETRTRLEELGPEVPETIKKHHDAFCSLRYQFEKLGDSRRVTIPKPVDPLHGVARTMVEALAQEPDVREVAARAGSQAPRRRGGTASDRSEAVPS